MLLAGAASAAILDQVVLLRSGGAIEVHFRVRGALPPWHSSGHGEELWIDLGNTRVVNPGRALYATDEFPIRRVNLLELGGGAARLVIAVSGKVDYAVAHLPQELVVRIAPAGELPDIAAPLFAEMTRYRPSSRVVVPQRMARESSAAMARPLRRAERNRGPKSGIAEGSRQSPAGLQRVEPESGRPVGNPADDLQKVAITPEAATMAHRPLVVIDAGHGGFDPGTSSADGTQEKNVALEIAERLGHDLEERGVNVELTRDDDHFLSLAERTERANLAHADLFVSIHLNSSPNTTTTGIETYYLNNTTDRATIRLARMENGSGEGSGAPAEPNLNYILTNLRQDFKANESAALAGMIEAETAARAESSLGIRVNDLGAKQGPFYVLVGAEMPSVLVECGFLSNPQEARMLTEGRYQGALADGIADAVVHYFNADAAVGNL